MFPGSDMSGWGEESCAQHENTQFGRGRGSRKGEDGLSDIYRKKSGPMKKGPTTFTGFLGKEGAFVVAKRVKGWLMDGIKEERRRKRERRNCGCQTSDTSAWFDHPTHLHFLDQTRLHPIQSTTGKQNTHPPSVTNFLGFTQLFCFSSYEKY